MDTSRQENRDKEPLTRRDFELFMAGHEQNEADQKKAMLDKFMSAFPGGDPVPHCNYHQSKIDAAKAEQRFWELAQAKIVEKGIEGIFGAIKIVVILAITGAAYKLGLTLPFLGGK